MRLFLIALLTALPAVLFAQSNYHSGYVVKNNGDTLKGYIDYREWERTPKTIQFKTSNTDKNILEFDPQTIKSFEINGMEQYMSDSGLISMDQTNFPDLPTGLDTSKMLNHVFLRQLTTGKYLTLYYQKDNIKKRFFIAESNGTITELKYYQYHSDEHNVIESAYYKGQLGYYINQFDTGNEKSISMTGRTQFTQADLQRIVDKINGHDGETNNKVHRQDSRFFAGIGANYTQTLYDLAGYTGGYLEASSAKAYPKLFAGFDVFINPNVQQTLLRAELSVFYVNPGFILLDGEVYTFNQYTIGITPQILFNNL